MALRLSVDGVVFRRARGDDLAVVVALLADDELGRERETSGAVLDEAYRAAFEAIDRDPNQLLAIAERSGRVIAVLQLTFIPGITHRGMWRGQIEGVRVAGDQRGSGVGRAFLQWAIGECRKRGCGLVQLTSDKRRTDAQRFYHALGFRPTHEGYKLAL